MTSETYLDITFERSGKSGKRPLKPRLLKLTDAAIPRRNRKKTKTKTKDRSMSSVRDRIYDDPAYTDDISHLANPLRPQSNERRSSNLEFKSDFQNLSATVSGGGGGSLGKRSKISKEFVLYANKQHINPKNVGGGSGSGGDGIESQGHECSSSSDEHLNLDQAKMESAIRRGRSLDRTVLEKTEKRRDRTTSKQQRRNASLSQTSGINRTQKDTSKESMYKERSSREFNNEPEKTWNKQTLDPDVASTSTASGSKMHLGRRFLRGEIGIKSFNYYLLKEGLKSSKRLVGKQRNANISTRSASSKKQQSHSEENIYEEVFFKNASASDEENQNNASTTLTHVQKTLSHTKQQKYTQLAAEAAPDTQDVVKDNVFTNCDLCMQHCTKGNCEYCYAIQMGAQELQTVGLATSTAGSQFSKHKQTFDVLRPHAANDNSRQAGGLATNNSDSGNNNIPAAHILEFQSYNPNNPGVYKTETTPVAITGEYNPMLQFQQPQPPPQTSADRTQAYVQAKMTSSRYMGQENLNISGISIQPNHCFQSNIIPLVAAQARQRGQRFVPAYQQPYILNYNGGMPSGPVNNLSMNAKSSSSSDSLQQQYKLNTVARMEANLPYGDPFYGGSTNGLVHMHPLIYASSRPIGGSQILLDPYDQSPHMYKSDSHASILSEYSLRSSDNSHRYGRFLHRRNAGGRGEVSDSSLGDSLFSCASTQRRYFGSSESCRFGFECRRCSLDGGAAGVGIGIGLGGSVIGVGTKIGVLSGNVEKCSFSDTCRYDCRNCDCSSSYFSSDFDDYGNATCNNIPRKTAAGILTPDTTAPSHEIEGLEEHLDRKQNKYARDFFKHVNDVKRSIYQSEMQRNGSVETNSNRAKSSRKPADQRQRSIVQSNETPNSLTKVESIGKQHELSNSYSTLPLAKDRTRMQNFSAKVNDSNLILKQVSVPRNTLQDKLTQRRSAEIVNERSNNATATGAIPKISSTSKPNFIVSDATNNEDFTQQNSKAVNKNLTSKSMPEDAKENQAKSSGSPINSDQPSQKQNLKNTKATVKKPEQLLNVSPEGSSAIAMPLKRYHRSSSHRTSSSTSSRRKDTPAAPPPSPATYSDLQELQANLESMQDDTKSPKRATSVDLPSLSTHTWAEIDSKKSENNSSKINTIQDLQTSNKYTQKEQRAQSQPANMTALDRNKLGSNMADIEDDDIFYDARSEDSCCNANIKKDNKSDDRNDLAANEANQKSNNEQQNSKEKEQSITNMDIAITHIEGNNNSNNDVNNESQKKIAIARHNETSVQHEKVIERQSKKDNSNETKESKTTTNTAAQDDFDFSNNFNKNAHDNNDDGDVGHDRDNNDELKIKHKTTLMEIKWLPPTTQAALNPTEGSITATAKTAAIKAALDQKHHQFSRNNDIAYPISSISKSTRRSGERRSKSSTTRYYTNRHATAGASATATASLTISCDTCCKVECNEKKKEQATTKTNSNNRMWRLKAESETTSPNIKEQKSKTHQEGERTQQHTKIEAFKRVATDKTDLPQTPLTCAEKQLPSTTIVNATTVTTTKTTTAIIPTTQTTAIATAVDDTQNNFQNSNNVVEVMPSSYKLVDDDTKASNIDNDVKTSEHTTTMETLNTSATLSAETLNENAAEQCAIQKAVAPKLESPTSFNVSLNSDIAGVATSTNSAVDLTIAITTPSETAETIQPIEQTESLSKQRRTLQRQDYSYLDSSEPQSDDSHLTRDSITRESQNDELSSSALDKIDLSVLPLPALPPKKRRTRPRASPSKYYHSRSRFENVLSNIEHAAGQENVSSALDDPTEAKNLSAFQQYVAKRRESLEASARCFDEKLEARNRMHFHMTGSGGGSATASDANVPHLPTYFLGENYCSRTTRQPANSKTHEEIFLNKSGWVQVNTKRGHNDNRGSHRHFLQQNAKANSNADMRNAMRVIQMEDAHRADLERKASPHYQHSKVNDSHVYDVPKFVVSKLEELIKNNDSRFDKSQDNHVARNPQLRPGYRIVDPHLATILNERPGFLPVRSSDDIESPPPITPILSPPPAFQDSSKSKRLEHRKTNKNRQPLVQPITGFSTGLYAEDHRNASTNVKGMVFSRSFEYDMRQPTPKDTYVETFSRSFDGNLSERPTVDMRRERSPNFSSLTGNSPNYLTKKDSGGGSSGSLRSRDDSPKYLQPRTTAFLNASVKETPPSYSIANTASSRHSPRTRRERSFERSRKSQFNRTGSSGLARSERSHANIMSRFRSFDTTISQRLNSCDSGARSDLSNDELDNDDAIGSTEFLTINYHHSVSPIKKQQQRSLTPERNESRSSSGSLRKQHSLTPESRSLTPEDRQKRGSEASLLGFRTNSTSRSNTLERKQRLDDKTPFISRSSSSSSYSGSREHEPQGSNNNQLANVNTVTINSSGQHRRSLNRSAKPIDEHRIRRSRSLQLSERSPNRNHNVNACAGQQLLKNTNYQQQTANSSNNTTQMSFPTKVRTTGKSQPLLFKGHSSSTDSNVNLSSGNRMRGTDMDKSHSLDFDYNYYKTSTGVGTGAGKSGSNKNVPLRLDFDKSRSFDDDYKEATPVNSVRSVAKNPNLRYLQTVEGNAAMVRLRKTSPGNAIERNTCSTQQSGSPCSNMRPQRQTTSPQNYGTRLCDHELTYDKLRKTLDRSPIMDFCQGSNSNDYDTSIPISQRADCIRETVHSGGNSELNFMNTYEIPKTSNSGRKQQRPLGHSSSVKESPYATPDSDFRYRQSGHYHTQQHSQLPREPRSGTRGSLRRKTLKTKRLIEPSISENANAKTSSFRSCCGACRNSRSLLKPSNSFSTTVRIPFSSSSPSYNHSITTNTKYIEDSNGRRNKSPWRLLCSGVRPLPSSENFMMTQRNLENSTLICYSDDKVSVTLKNESTKQPKRPSKTKNYISQTEIRLTPTIPSKINENDPDDLSRNIAKKEANSSIPPTITSTNIKPIFNESYDKPNKYEFISISLPDLTYHMLKIEDHCTRRGSPKKLKLRAVSTPTLTEPLLEQTDDLSKCSPINQSKLVRPNSYPNSSVLQKFKRTFGGLSKNNNAEQIEQQTVQTSSTSLTSAMFDVPCGKNRLNSLFTRSPKDKHNTKVNRSGKCNSSDSGIQIELEASHGRMLSKKHHLSLNTELSANDEIVKTEQSAVEIHSKKRIIPINTTNISISCETETTCQLVKCVKSEEKEAPESLPTRSMSQLHDLQTFKFSKLGTEKSERNITLLHEEETQSFPIYAEVLHNFTAVGPQELSLQSGTLVEILRKEPGPWWFGRLKKYKQNIVDEILDLELGWFPKEFVRIIQQSQADEFFQTQLGKTEKLEYFLSIRSSSNQSLKHLPELKESENDETLTIIKSADGNNVTTIIIDSPTTSPTSCQQLTESLQHNIAFKSVNILRLSAIKELLTTEVNYVKLLKSICEGYLPAMSKRIDIFPPNSIRLILSNITAIYGFQLQFLEALRKGIEQNQIAKIFLKMHKGFLCYSTYCNSYPRALIELETYDRIKEAHIIWENCREAENLAEFPLAAHLLSPVQRICRYPLHLGELLKMSTKDDENDSNYEEMKVKLEQLEQHDASLVDLPDTYRTIEMALEAMKGITEAVNEGKRHSETISRHQSSFQNFKGPPLHLHSTRFFLQIDATRQKQNLWNSSYTLFLFDNQLIYCKRDIIKRSQFIYKGRMFIDRCRVVNVRDGKMFGQTIKNALRIYCEAREKWYDFSFRSASRKQKFLHTLALERQFGGKALYVTEMTGFEYALRERNASSLIGAAEYSDQSDYEFSETDFSCVRTRFSREFPNDISSGSGNSSLPQSPTKLNLAGSSLTLPKKSKSGDNFGLYNENQTSSLRHGRIGNWFRKPKSTNSTPNLSPTCKPLLPVPLIAQSKDLQLQVINKLGNGTEKANEKFFAEI